MTLQNEHSASFFFILLPITKISTEFSGGFFEQRHAGNSSNFFMPMNVNSFPHSFTTGDMDAQRLQRRRRKGTCHNKGEQKEAFWRSFCFLAENICCASPSPWLWSHSREDTQSMATSKVVSLALARLEPLANTKLPQNYRKCALAAGGGFMALPERQQG